MLKTILQNKILKIFFLKVLMLFGLLAILFGDFDEIFSTKIYAFWGAGKGGEIKKMETICLPFKNVGFTGDSFCHELTKRSQKHHTKILYMYLYDSNEICKGRLKILNSKTTVFQH